MVESSSHPFLLGRHICPVPTSLVPIGIAAPSDLQAEMIRWWLPCPSQYMLVELNQRHDNLQPEQAEAGGLSSQHGMSWRKMFLWPYVPCLRIMMIDLSLPFEWHCKVVTILFPVLLLIVKIWRKCAVVLLCAVYVGKQSVSDIEFISPVFWRVFLLEAMLTSAAHLPAVVFCFSISPLNALVQLRSVFLVKGIEELFLV